MLQTIRDKLVGYLLWVVILGIAVPFAFVGLEEFRTGGGDPTLAKVGDQKITQSQFDNRYRASYQQMAQLFGERFNPETLDQNLFRQNVLDQMLEEATLKQYSNEAGFRTTDQALKDFYASVPAFQDNGKFSLEKYNAVLANQGLSDAAFTALQRERLAMAQKDDLLFNTAFITPAQAQNAWRLNEQTRAFDYVTINLGMFKANVTDAQIAAHYNAKKDNYKAPERMQVEYVLLDRDTLPPATPPDAAVIKALFDADPKRFITEEGRTVRHLLVSFAGDKPENKLAAKAKADILLKEIKAGGDFALLAKANSGDTGSAENGGLLPDPVRQDGQMVPAFEKAVFAAKVGDVTEPVETQYGYHLIRVDAIQPKAARSATDPTVVAELTLDYQRKDAEKRFKALSDELEKLAFENPTSLEAVVKATKVPAKSTDWFTRSTAAASSELVNITTSEDIRAAAFAKNVAQEGDNSTPVTLKAGQQVVVLRKKAYEAARQRTLAEATPEIRAELEVQSNTAQAKARAEALLKVVQAGQSLATVAAAQNLSLNSVAAGKRDRTDATPELVKRAFALPRPTAKPSADSITLRTGDVVLIQLTNVTDVPAADEKSEAFLQFAARQRDEANNTLREAFRKALESRIPSKVLKAPVASVTAP